MSSLSDLHIRVQTLAGQIKQADADVAESLVLRERAVKTLEREEAALARATERAAELRKQIESIAEEAHASIRAVAQIEATENSGINSGEGVIQSPGVGVFAESEGVHVAGQSGTTTVTAHSG